MTEISAFSRHDHAGCVASAMRVAEARCAQSKLQFTPLRRRVLELLLESHKALGAYDVLARLDAEGLGSQPPVAYRALAFLVENGLAHKIERLNAFVACAHPQSHDGGGHEPAFMICRGCRKVAEADLPPPIAAAEAGGFRIERTVIEAEGLCPACQTAPAAEAAP